MTDSAGLGAPAGSKPERRYSLSRLDKVVAVLLALGLFCLLLWPFTLFAVPSGRVGVIYHLLTYGTETKYVYDEGLGIKWPWDRIYLYDVRTQALDQSVYGLAVDGLSIKINVTVLFHPYQDKVGVLHKSIGQNYAEYLVRPAAIEAVRGVVGQYGPYDLFRINADVLQEAILIHLRPAGRDLIDFTDVIVRQIDFPPQLNAAITKKLTEQQNAETYRFILEQARQQAEQERIRAIGLQTFYSIVANALTPQLLTWRGIEATVQIAKSNNTKIVIVGGGKDQLPLILGNDIAQQPNLPAPGPVDPTAHELPSFQNLPSLFPGGEYEPSIDRPDAASATGSAPVPTGAGRAASPATAGTLSGHDNRTTPPRTPTTPANKDAP
jgi:regulator of protease activity HflC (stomatin/prohibitin superfamily)